MDVELTEFLLARIAEDEAVVRAVVEENHDERRRCARRGIADTPQDAETDFDLSGPVDGPSGWAALYIGPARVLAECEAKRRIVERCDAVGASMPCEPLAQGVLHLLAQPYAAHPDFREEWRP